MDYTDLHRPQLQELMRERNIEGVSLRKHQLIQKLIEYDKLPADHPDKSIYKSYNLDKLKAIVEERKLSFSGKKMDYVVFLMTFDKLKKDEDAYMEQHSLQSVEAPIIYEATGGGSEDNSNSTTPVSSSMMAHTVQQKRILSPVRRPATELLNAENSEIFSDHIITVSHGQSNVYLSQLKTCKNFPPKERTTGLEIYDPNSRFSFRDNTEYFYKFFEQNKDGTYDFNMKCALIRPRRYGKSTFGRVLLEFFKGNEELLRGTNIYKMMKLPSKEAYVCIHLDFSEISEGGFIPSIRAAFNEGLKKIDRSIGDDVIYIENMIDDLANIVNDSGKKVAMFIDEYDGFVRAASDRNEYERHIKTMTIFLSRLKARSDIISSVFITGSSKLSIRNIWSGPNDIEDLSYKPDWNGVLGYSWEDINNTFSDQLRLMEKIYNVHPDVLQKSIESMYNGNKFSPGAIDKIYSFWSINRFLEEGRFKAYHSISGLSGFLTRMNFYDVSIRALARPNLLIRMTENDLESWRYGKNLEKDEKENMEDMTTPIMTLLGAGVLSFYPVLESSAVFFKVPNEDSLYALTNVLSKYTTVYKAEKFNRSILMKDFFEAFNTIKDDLYEIAVDTGRTEILKQTSREGDILEYHHQNAFFAILTLMKTKLSPESINWRRTSETTVFHGRADFVLYIQNEQEIEEPYVFEFGRYEDLNPGENVLKTQLFDKMNQGMTYAWSFGASTPVVVVLWTVKGKLLCVGGPFYRHSIKKVINEMKPLTWEQIGRKTYMRFFI